MKKVLMIAYPFPPMGGSGVQRTVKFVKYLPRLGWAPVVLTVKNPPLDEADPSLLFDMLGPIEIHRAWSLEPHRLLTQWGRGNFNDGSDSGRDPEPHGSRKEHNALLRRIKRFIDTWAFIPDRQIGWFPSALFDGLRILRASKIDVIYSSSDPFTDHLIGYSLKRLSGKPWIADFRDPWTGYTLYQHPSKLRHKLDVSLEGRFLRAADRIVVTCRSAIGAFMATHQGIDEEKFLEITNGFDPTDFFAPSSEKKADGSCTIVYMGRFWDQKNYSPNFLKAVRELLDEKEDLRKHMRVIFVGDFGEEATKLLLHLGLHEDIEVVDYRSHRKSIEFIQRADILLLTVNNIPGAEHIYPGKLFEYLVVQKPILALATEGAAADLIREMRAGVVVCPDDIGAIKKTICALYKQVVRDGQEAGPRPSLKQFERFHLTKALARCLDEVVDRGLAVQEEVVQEDTVRKKVSSRRDA